MCNDVSHVHSVSVIHDTHIIKAFLCESMPWIIQVFRKAKLGACLVSTKCTCHEYPVNKQAWAENKHHASSCVCCLLYMYTCWVIVGWGPEDPLLYKVTELSAWLSWGVLIGMLPCCSAAGRWRLKLSQKWLCLMIDYNYGLLCKSWLSWVGELTRVAET